MPWADSPNRACLCVARRQATRNSWPAPPATATFTTRLDNLRQDIADREATPGDNFSIVLDGEMVTNRGIAGELLIRPAEKLKNRVCEEVLVGRFAGFELFVRTNLDGDADLVLRGKNSYAARVKDA